MRKINFANGEYYHIYNRGVDKRDVFCTDKDYARFLESTREFNNIEPTISLRDRRELKNRGLAPGKSGAKPLLKLVEINCYCFNPNHFHFMIKQLSDGGISEFMKRLGGGYTSYFNKTYERSGSLFQGAFKAVHIDTNEYFLWLSGYINGNAEIHKVPDAKNYKWCSFPDYMEMRTGNLCRKEKILSQFLNINEYKNYVDMVIKESGKRKDAEKYYLEDNE